MKAAVLEKFNAPLIVEELELPSLLHCGQVLVDMKAAAICGAQMGEISGAKGEDPYLPHLLGHEGSGIVKEVGPGVRNVKVGNHVVVHWRKGVGIDAIPAKYSRRDKSGSVGGGPAHTFCSEAVVSENRLTAIGADIPFEIAALFGCAVTTGLGLISNEAQLKMGEFIAVSGCGGVGLSVIHGASKVSPSAIIAIDINEDALDKAATLGATHFVNANGTQRLDKTVRSIAVRRGGTSYGVDVFVECTGIPEMIMFGYELIAPGGRLILVGQPRYDQAVTLRAMRQHYCGKLVLDSQGGLTNPTDDIPRYLRMWRDEKLMLKHLIGAIFPLKEINHAFDMIRSGRVTGKCIITM